MSGKDIGRIIHSFWHMSHFSVTDFSHLYISIYGLDGNRSCELCNARVNYLPECFCLRRKRTALYPSVRAGTVPGVNYYKRQLEPKILICGSRERKYRL